MTPPRNEPTAKGGGPGTSSGPVSQRRIVRSPFGPSMRRARAISDWDSPSALRARLNSAGVMSLRGVFRVEQARPAHGVGLIHNHLAALGAGVGRGGPALTDPVIVGGMERAEEHTSE